ncbi:Netrin-4 [Liparis tanakae]|uniref:Netrin-4 n=1 Tax=Liparis tanakae TaxID=230148 RepID=A0A4Z2F5J4_9TELE|nr:Netrin-4 [Liparis tanakae]
METIVPENNPSNPSPSGRNGRLPFFCGPFRNRLLLSPRQPCPCQAKDLAAATREAPPTRHFAVYDLVVKGSCLCNGHAEQCVPAPRYRPVRDRTNHVVRRFYCERQKRKAFILLFLSRFSHFFWIFITK